MRICGTHRATFPSPPNFDALFRFAMLVPTSYFNITSKCSPSQRYAENENYLQQKLSETYQRSVAKCSMLRPLRFIQQKLRRRDDDSSNCLLLRIRFNPLNPSFSDRFCLNPNNSHPSLAHSPSYPPKLSASRQAVRSDDQPGSRSSYPPTPAENQNIRRDLSRPGFQPGLFARRCSIAIQTS